MPTVSAVRLGGLGRIDERKHSKAGLTPLSTKGDSPIWWCHRMPYDIPTRSNQSQPGSTGKVGDGKELGTTGDVAVANPVGN
ncbi:MAG TPA: hypothetical protein VIV60_10380 [Polyangiaceae bacterium]